MILPESALLPESPDLPPDVSARLAADYERTATASLDVPFEPFLLDRYGLDTRGRYAGRLLRNPWGKGSGQLSMRLSQVRDAIDDGLGLVILKTVIAQDSSGDRSMSAWAVPEARMVVEPAIGRSGRVGHTVTWAGRGWSGTFDEYLELVERSTALGRHSDTLVVPSVKYHLPSPGESTWRTGEYEETTRRLLDAYRGPDGPMPLEKDFSPTLAGSDRAAAEAVILNWLRSVTRLIRSSADGRPISVGLKLFNALFDDAFQLQMLDLVSAGLPNPPDFLVYANRLFDPDREFDGRRGVARGGPDLSDRNLRVLSAWRTSESGRRDPLELSATGDISTGRIAVEYALRGATSFQIHTAFQLPTSDYDSPVGSKVRRALRSLILHPTEGFVAWLLHATSRLGLSPSLLALADHCRHASPTELREALAAPGGRLDG